MEDIHWRGVLIGAAAIIIVFLAILGFGWRMRVRAAERWKALLDVYARREIAREARQKERRRFRIPSPLT